MINDDPTQSLPDRDKTTQPTLAAILERLLGFEARAFDLQLLESRFESQIALVRAAILSLREDMNSQFRASVEQD